MMISRSWKRAAAAAAVVAAFAPWLWAQGTPRMTTVTPGAGKVGDALTVEGENLTKDFVAKLYLTDGKNDYEVAMEEQTDKAIKFRVTKNVKPGRLSLMVLTAKEPKLIEQPVRVTIE
jgi:hypothetical protein